MGMRHGLVLDDVLAALTPAIRVVDAGVERRPRQRHEMRRHLDVARGLIAAQLRRQVGLAAAEQVLGGDAGVVEEELGLVVGAPPDLVVDRAHPDAGRPLLDDQVADALRGADVGVGAHPRNPDRGVVNVRAPLLHAVDDVVVAVADGGGHDALAGGGVVVTHHVGADVGLGDGEGEEKVVFVAVAGEIALLLVFGARDEEQRSDLPVLGENLRAAHVLVGHLVDDDELGEGVGFDAAPLGGERQGPQAELRPLLDQVPGEVVGDVALVHRHGDGAYLVAGEVARQALEGALVLGEVEFEHGAP